MDHIAIRKAEIGDVQGLSELFVEFIGEKSNAAAMKNQLEILSNHPNYFVAAACDGNRVVGTAMGIICYDLVGHCYPFMLIENVVVSFEYRGQGVGKLLLQALEEFGQKNKCSYAMLMSSGNRESAHKFYESIGYSTDKRGFVKRLV